MNELEQVWRERIDWVQASGLTIAEANEEPGVSAASVYHWKKLLAESPVPDGIRQVPKNGLQGRRSLRDRRSRFLPFRYNEPIGRLIRQGPPRHSTPAALLCGLFCQTAS